LPAASSRRFGIGDQFLKARIGAQIVPFGAPRHFGKVDEAAFAQGYGVPGRSEGIRGCSKVKSRKVEVENWNAQHDDHFPMHSKSLSPFGRQNSLQPAVRQYSGIFIFLRNARNRGSLRSG
jgi:hypothetical protein